MTNFEKWVKDAKISTQLRVAFICKHYDGNCKRCLLNVGGNHICFDNVKTQEYLDAESEDKV